MQNNIDKELINPGGGYSTKNRYGDVRLARVTFLSSTSPTQGRKNTKIKAKLPQGKEILYFSPRKGRDFSVFLGKFLISVTHRVTFLANLEKNLVKIGPPQGQVFGPPAARPRRFVRSVPPPRGSVDDNFFHSKVNLKCLKLSLLSQ